jgi:hypothetical protein
MLVRVTAGLFAAALVVPVFADPPAVPLTVPARAPVPEKAAPEKNDLAKRLAARVTLEKGFDCPLEEAVKVLATAYDLPVILDPRLGGDGLAMCGAEGHPVKLPKLTNVRLSTVLDLLAEQVRGKVIVYPDYIKVVPMAHWAYETGVLSTETNPNNPNEEPLLSQQDLVLAKPLTQRAPVNLTFRAKPLSEALEEIAEATGANVALAPSVPADVRKAPVTARFANVPVAVAVRTLCELTDTGVIEDLSVLVVTTRERATARAKEDAQKRRDREPAVVYPPYYGCFAGVQGNLGGCLFSGGGQLGFGGAPNPGAGFGGNPAPGGGGVVGMGMGQPQDDALKLKAQNEQLRKELEELKKALKK